MTHGAMRATNLTLVKLKKKTKRKERERRRGEERRGERGKRGSTFSLQRSSSQFAEVSHGSFVKSKASGLGSVWGTSSRCCSHSKR